MFEAYNVEFELSVNDGADDSARSSTIESSCALIAPLTAVSMADKTVQSDLRSALAFGVPIIVLHVRSTGEVTVRI